MVKLVREPTNSHDRWAVCVENFRGQQVGYLPRRVVAVVRYPHCNILRTTNVLTRLCRPRSAASARLWSNNSVSTPVADLMDHDEVRLKGLVTRASSTADIYDIPVEVYCFGAPNARSLVR